MVKPFRFRLLPFSLKALLCALCSCSFNPNFQGRGTDFLQGEWQQDSVESQHRLVNYSLYHFRFTCDSFFVRMQCFSKVNYGADTCMNNGRWNEYARGVYARQNDTLHLKGFYCNADQTLKDAGGCFNSGVYEDHFKIYTRTDTLIGLRPLSNAIPVKLRLLKKLVCVPKPL